jgi:hypothetical protein
MSFVRACRKSMSASRIEAGDLRSYAGNGAEEVSDLRQDYKICRIDSKSCNIL